MKHKSLSPRPAAATADTVAGNAGPGTSSALAAALNLAAMSPDDLARAGLSLAHAEARYDRLSGICATLGGLVLLEAKRRLPRGSFMHWTKRHFGKDHSKATRRMRVAEEFLGKSKVCSRAHFENTQLVFDDLAAALAEEKSAPLDLENPVVAAVAEYVDGRSYRALVEQLPPARKGGKTYERENGKGDRHPPTPEEIRANAELVWKPIIALLTVDGIEERSWAHLSDPLMRELKQTLIELNKLIPVK